jgi:hypothetical protein
MADCQFTLVQTKVVSKAGDVFEIRMKPALQPSCTIRVAIDGEDVDTRDTHGGVHFSGVGGTGRAEFRATEANPTAVVTFTVNCTDPACHATSDLVVDSERELSGSKHGLAENILDTIFLPFTLVLIVISLIALLIAWLIGLIPGVGDLTGPAKASLKQLADALPDWLSGPADWLRSLASSP